MRSLSREKCIALETAIELVLARRGLDVVETEFGKALGGGLYEFRLRWSAEEVAGKAAAVLAEPVAETEGERRGAEASHGSAGGRKASKGGASARDSQAIATGSALTQYVLWHILESSGGSGEEGRDGYGHQVQRLPGQVQGSRYSRGRCPPGRFRRQDHPWAPVQGCPSGQGPYTGRTLREERCLAGRYQPHRAGRRQSDGVDIAAPGSHP